MSSLRERLNAELERIREENGGTLKQQDVVEFARNPGTALHGQFTWDDTKAAEEYRLQQASRVIRLYVIRSTDDQRAPVRALVSLAADRSPKSGLPGYRHIDDVMNDEQLTENLLQTALMELRAFRRKYETLKELAGVWREVEAVEIRHSNTTEQRASA